MRAEKAYEGYTDREQFSVVEMDSEKSIKILVCHQYEEKEYRDTERLSRR
jgi:hypothetical protein